MARCMRLALREDVEGMEEGLDGGERHRWSEKPGDG